MMLQAGETSVTVDPHQGGRLSSLVVRGRELLVQPAEVDDDPTLWGLYPMVPWAGRVRDGRFTFDGVEHHLPLDAPPHALHGVGYTSAWHEVDPAALRLDLDWPLGGWAEQQLELTASALTLRLTVGNEVRTMPAVIGFHPCFRGGAEAVFQPTEMWQRDDFGIPDGRLVPVTSGPWDDAFEVHDPLRVVWPDLELTLTAETTTWVVYDHDPRLTCVEPQTDAPDAFNRRRPTTVGPAQPLSLALELRWSTP
jgi:aldose 1-epimerase